MRWLKERLSHAHFSKCLFSSISFHLLPSYGIHYAFACVLFEYFLVREKKGIAFRYWVYHIFVHAISLSPVFVVVVLNIQNLKWTKRFAFVYESRIGKEKKMIIFYIKICIWMPFSAAWIQITFDFAAHNQSVFEPNWHCGSNK